MKKKPDTSYVHVGSTRERRRHERDLEPTMEIQVSQAMIAVEILFREYGAGDARGFRIHRPFYTTGVITEEAEELMLDAFKKHKNIITITPKLIEELPEIIIGYMEKMGYDIMQVRTRIRSLQKGKQRR